MQSKSEVHIKINELSLDYINKTFNNPSKLAIKIIQILNIIENPLTILTINDIKDSYLDNDLAIRLKYSTPMQGKQLEKLIRLAELSNIEIQILPFSRKRIVLYFSFRTKDLYYKFQNDSYKRLIL